MRRAKCFTLLCLMVALSLTLSGCCFLVGILASLGQILMAAAPAITQVLGGVAQVVAAAPPLPPPAQPVVPDPRDVPDYMNDPDEPFVGTLATGGGERTRRADEDAVAFAMQEGKDASARAAAAKDEAAAILEERAL